MLISTEWITGVNWHDSKVEVAMSREEVRTSPQYDPQQLSEEQEQEQALYRHFGRQPGKGPRIQIR